MSRGSKKKVKRKPIPKNLPELVVKIQSQLEDFKKSVSVWPVGTRKVSGYFRTVHKIAELTVEDYKRMDPFWMSTMTGEFAGRKICDRKYLKGNMS